MPAQTTETHYNSYWTPDPTSWSPHPTLTPRKLALFEQLISKTSVVLDVGCGDGMHYGARFAHVAQAYHGLDVSSVAVQSARTHGILAQQHNLENVLPFPDSMFDVVICIEVVEHLFEPAFVLGEIKRVLKPAGKLLLAVPNIAHFGNRLRLAFGGFAPGGTPETSARRPWADPHIRFFTVRSFRAFVAEQQMEITRLYGEGFAFFSALPVVSPLLAKWVGWERLDRWSQPIEFMARIMPSICAGHLIAVVQPPR
ncbi:MAG: methyltransferase domain-containing protein [Chloroflexi bacterium]|nr:methyltransferase domain-containing protein [Chloroflexota bacterium]